MLPAAARLVMNLRAADRGATTAAGGVAAATTQNCALPASSAALRCSCSIYGLYGSNRGKTVNYSQVPPVDIKQLVLMSGPLCLDVTAPFVLEIAIHWK